ncbi:MAG: hypothetical protein LUI07_05635, partial [Lachnospiraceae bacterium]|nr:hypothetical protein [Lachnospiraceae bacterium]
PYNSDGRGTQFNGAYQLKSVELVFQTEDDYQAYLDGTGAVGAGTSGGVLRYTSEEKVTNGEITAQNDLITEASDTTSTAWTTLDYESAGEDGSVWKVTYSLPDQKLVCNAEDTSAPALYCFIPTVSGDTDLQIRITLSPVDGDGDLLTDSNTLTQQGNNIYYNTFFSRTDGASGTATPLTSKKVFVKTVRRTITGLIWMDQDQDGIYVSQASSAGSTDQPLEGIEVGLYTTTDPGDIGGVTRTVAPDGTVTWTYTDGGNTYTWSSVSVNGVTYYPATDVLGKLVDKVTTGADGAYSFTNLASGTYYVLVTDSDGDYTVPDTGTQPIAFGRLSVTSDKYSGTTYTTPAAATNKSVEDYGGVTDAELTTVGGVTSGGAATLQSTIITNNGSGISLPTLESMQVANYVTNNWNSGLCYIDLTMEKQWENILNASIEEGNSVTLTLTGTIGSGSTTVVNETYTVTQGSADVTAVDSAGNTVTVTETKNTTAMEVVWTLTSAALQAKGASGEISYSVTETAKDSSGEELVGYLSDVSYDTQGSVMTVKAINTQILYELELYKISSSAGSSTYYLSDAEFTLYSDSTCKNAVATSISGTGSDSGKIYFGYLQPGVYYLKETQAPSGYALNLGLLKVEITYPTNAPTTPTITVTQLQDEATGSTLPSGGTSYSKQDSLEDPSASGTLLTNIYTAAGNTGGTLYTISFAVEDDCVYELPATGSVGILWPTLGGVALMLVALAMSERKRWRME